MTQRLLLLVAASTVLIIADTGCERSTALTTSTAEPVPSSSPSNATEKTGNESAAEPVPVGRPVRKSLVLTTTQPGRIEAFESTPLVAKVSGYVREVLVDIGDRVEKDQPIIRLAVPELEDELRQKQALLARARAAVGQVQAALKASEAAQASSQAAVEQARAGAARTDADYERWRAESGRLDSLAAAGSVTQKVADETRHQFQSADAARKESAAAIRSATAAVAEAAASVEKARADIVAAEAQVNVAEAEVAQAETMLDYTVIKAPFAGVVTKRSVDSGHFVSQSGAPTPLAAIARTDRIRVFLEIPEMEAAKVDIGDPATVRVQALDGFEITGAVTRTGWALDDSNRSLSTEIDLANQEDRFRPGMYATAAIQLEKRDDALTLPVAAVSRKPEGAFCFVVRDGKAVRTPIQLGLRVGSEWEIASGLSGDETVALAKADTLQDSQPVAPVDANP